MAKSKAFGHIGAWMFISSGRTNIEALKAANYKWCPINLAEGG